MEAFINEMVEPRVLDLFVLILPKWRLLVYIFLMNIVLVTPVYVFGALVSNDPDMGLICPPIVLVGFNLVHRAVFRCGSERYTRSLLLGVTILCVGISSSGLAAMYAPHNLLIVLLYGAVGGFGYQLVCSRMWKVLATVFNARKEMFVIQFLHSSGQATSLLLLLAGFQLPWEGYIYGALLMPLTGVVLHLVPLVLLVSGERSRLRRDVDELVRHTEKGNESYYTHVATRAAPLERPVPGPDVTPVTWRNPANLRLPRSNVPAELPPEEPFECEYEEEECDEPMLVRREGKCFNPDGVEILEMIVEEDEDDVPEVDPKVCRMRDDLSERSSEQSDKWGWLRQPAATVEAGCRSIGRHLASSVNVRVIGSTRRTLGDLRCCSCALLKATDACIFVLFLAILPRFTAFHYPQRTRARHMTLLAVVVIASAWAGTSFLLLCCELRFRKQRERLLVFGLLFQAFGYFCVYAIKSNFWTVVGCVLIGAGHSIACCYQEPVMKRQLGQRRWDVAKAGLGLLAGLTVIGIAALANVLYVYGRIDHLLLTLLLIYSASGAFWMASSCRRFGS